MSGNEYNPEKYDPERAEYEFEQYGPEPDDYEPDFDEPTTHVTYHILVRGPEDFGSPCSVDWWTDDNDDDGYASDDDEARAHYAFNTVWEALHFSSGGSRTDFSSGGSRTGCIGTEVRVYLDGSEILTEYEEIREMTARKDGGQALAYRDECRPYCEWRPKP